MAFESWTSATTADGWRSVGSGKAIKLSVSLFITTLIALIVSIVINITSANEPGNDYGEGTGWVLMMPVLGIQFLWAIIAIILCKFSYFHPIAALVVSFCVGSAVIAMGILEILFYDWHTIAWLPGPFMLIAGINAYVIVWFASIALHKNARAAKGFARKGSQETA